ncbi:alpha/beta fold hydrolase [Sedimentitalea todarodis]|uniref:Alpha/beta fold hydrolase n=1 Tax=Sedimentitalea todarodis TaxID=1631240 RepID=A0ABU3VA83_9RHOB|nr:alpha/beta fold hydrolase [Sedimentitalea todarodis]MDU9002935.1 alpha/beta fold hydrolase [Sedimentitalea todarodis]
MSEHGADFLLVHGSCHGAWCWRDLIPELAALGHSAKAIDLPGHGQDTTPAKGQTLDACRDAVLAASQPDTVIVGHSWGGYPIAAAAETDADAMRGLVFLCAYVPVSGLSMVDMRKRAPRQPILPAVVRAPDGLTITIDPEQAPALFYNDCTPETVAFALEHLGPQAIVPQATPLTVTDRFERVPKAYIRCTDDQTIPPEYQAEMTRDWPRNRVHELPTSHSPFFSDPAALAALLGRICKDL